MVDQRQDDEVTGRSVVLSADTTSIGHVKGEHDAQRGVGEQPEPGGGGATGPTTHPMARR